MKIDGKHLAGDILKKLAADLKKTRKFKKIPPQLAVILVGNDPASLSYVKQKQIFCKKIGAKFKLIHFSKLPAYQEIVEAVLTVARDPLVHGVIVQRPMPPSLSAEDLNKRISIRKDVDGFLPKTLYSSPLGIAIFKIFNEIYYHQIMKRNIPVDDFSKNLLLWLKNKKIILMGRGETGGKPIAETLNQHRLNFINVTSNSDNTDEYFRNADIIISAVGKSNIINSTKLKPGVIIIGVGIHHEKKTLVGDFTEKEIENVASYFTPTPGGVGPVNVACLMQNLVKAYKLQVR